MPLSSKNFIASTLSNFRINSGKTLIKRLSNQLPVELISQLIIKENKKSYLQKYKTQELIDLIISLTNKGITKKEHIITIRIVSILAKRYKTYEPIIKNNPEKSPSEVIDDLLYPSKIITSVVGTNIFTIVNWKQLNIEIKDEEPNSILFKKIINGIPSNHKVLEKKLNELHLGLTTRTILKTFGYIDLDGSYNHPLKKKDQVFRLNKSLKELFKIPSHNNPFVWKKNKLFTDISITAYDINNTPVLPLT